MAKAFTGLLGFRQIVDDIVIYDSNATEHAHHVTARDKPILDFLTYFSFQQFFFSSLRVLCSIFCSKL